MKKILIFVLSAVLVLSLAACGNDTNNQSEQVIGDDPATWGPAVDGDPKVPEDSSVEDVEIPDPFVEYETLTEAGAAAGFDMEAPDFVDGYPQKVIRVLNADDCKMIEVIYENDEENEVRIRKAPGSDDISGDYNEYEQNSNVAIGESDVTLKGNGDTVNLATWKHGGYTYSVYVSTGITNEAISDLIAAVR